VKDPLVTAPLAYVLDETGWITGCRRVPSPNWDERPDPALIDMVVIHNISLPPGQFGGPGVEQLFTNQLDPAEHPYYAEIHHLRVSAHWLIRRDGELLQFVSAQKRAWHAGVSQWQGRTRCNDFSVGIELEGSDFEPFTLAQYHTLRQLLSAIQAAYPIRHIVGHSDIAPERKTDPGPYFDWQALHQPQPEVK
jgi:N-acetyl-anhydromuramoyl-L-alanine amidase